MNAEDDGKKRKDEPGKGASSAGAASEGAKSGGVTPFPAAARAKACPICGKPVKLESRPFCSKRCADIDLGRWLGEAYRIPAEEPPEGFDQEEPGPSEPPPRWP